MLKLKVLGLTLVAIGALSALAAASASANYTIASASGGTLSGSQATSNVFTTDVGNVTCTTATFEGEQASETASEITVHPTYSTCKLAGVKVTVNTGTCDYTFATPAELKATVSVVCASGNILIKDTSGLGCEVTVGAQAVGGNVAFTNEATSPTTVLVTSNAKEIDYAYTAGCPNAEGEAGSGENGTYSGSVLTKGFVGEEQVAISVK